MNAEKLANSGLPVPVIGKITIKDLLRFVALSVGVGASVYFLAKIPTVGAYVVTGWTKVKAWMA